MTAIGLAWGWYVGWGVGLVVVLVAAGLLLTIIRLGRQVEHQAHDITRALDGTRVNTAPLWEVRTTNHALDRITRGLAAAREGLTR